MMPPAFIRPEIGMELISSFTIMVCSLMVYFGTKEIYELSNYKGLKYFRQAFLFFALAYMLRPLIMLLAIVFGTQMIIDISPRFIGQATLFLFMYSSSMAVFFLLYSVSWKRLDKHKGVSHMFHLAAAMLALSSILSRQMIVMFGINLFLLALIIFVVYAAYKSSKKKKNSLYAAYVLLLVFWLLNIIDVLIPRFLQVFQIIVPLSLILMFLLILYKVLRKIGSG